MSNKFYVKEWIGWGLFYAGMINLVQECTGSGATYDLYGDVFALFHVDLEILGPEAGKITKWHFSKTCNSVICYSAIPFSEMTKIR